MLCYSLFEKSQQEWLLCQVGFSQQGTLYPENGVLYSIFSNLSCMFLMPSYFLTIWIITVLMDLIWETSKNNFKKHSVSKIVLTFHWTVRINCSSDLKKFANCQPSALNFKTKSQSLKQLFLTKGQNNLGNKIPKAVWRQK